MQLGLRIDHPLDYQVDSEGGWVTPVVQVSCRGRDVVGPAYVGSLWFVCAGVERTRLLLLLGVLGGHADSTGFLGDRKYQGSGSLRRFVRQRYRPFSWPKWGVSPTWLQVSLNPLNGASEILSGKRENRERKML
jgi:hypothetical protein